MTCEPIEGIAGCATSVLGFALVPATEPDLRVLHRWMDSWRGVGDIAVGMHRQGWDLQLTEYGDGHWRATFFVTGMAHSIVGGTAWEPTPWYATQRAAWEALNKTQRTG